MSVEDVGALRERHCDEPSARMGWGKLDPVPWRLQER
jgi:hypothetical protein